jgi:hypothetical protein
LESFGPPNFDLKLERTSPPVGLLERGEAHCPGRGLIRGTKKEGTDDFKKEGRVKGGGILKGGNFEGGRFTPKKVHPCSN